MLISIPLELTASYRHHASEPKVGRAHPILMPEASGLRLLDDVLISVRAAKWLWKVENRPAIHRPRGGRCEALNEEARRASKKVRTARQRVGDRRHSAAFKGPRAAGDVLLVPSSIEESERACSLSWNRHGDLQNSRSNIGVRTDSRLSFAVRPSMPSRTRILDPRRSRWFPLMGLLWKGGKGDNVLPSFTDAESCGQCRHGK